MADKDRAYLDSLTHAYNAIDLRNEMDYWGPAFPVIQMTLPEQPTIEAPREFHACEGGNRDISCEEMRNGELWFMGEDNESYYVNYCPFCGFKARKQWPYKGVSK